MNWTIILGILVGLIIFIHAIDNFSNEILNFAGEKFQKFLKISTKNRVIASLSGTLITGLIQSSAATTIITINLVSSGMLSFSNSLGIIFGANIGTTLTAQLVALKVTSFSGIFIVSGFLLGMFKRPYSYIGKGIFYFGLLFYGLNKISDTIIPLKDDPMLHELFIKLDNPYLALLAGLIFTAIFQSSTVTTGLVVILSSSGLISLEQGLPVLLGSNIGSTFVTLIESLKLSLYAKRGAVTHTFFNVAGVLMIFPFLSQFEHFINWIGGNVGQQIANAHTLFNVGTTIVFLIFLNTVKSLILKMVPGEEKELLIETKYLVNGLPNSNTEAFKLIEKELSYAMEIIFEFYELAMQVISNSKLKNLDTTLVDKYKALVDRLDTKIEEALLELCRRKISKYEAKKATLLVRISNILKQLADISKDLSKLPRSQVISTSSLSPEAIKDVKKTYKHIRKPLMELKTDFPENLHNLKELKREVNRVNSLITEEYGEHIQRLLQRKSVTGSLFVEASSLLENTTERLKDIIELSQKYSEIRKTEEENYI